MPGTFFFDLINEFFEFYFIDNQNNTIGQKIGMKYEAKLMRCIFDKDVVI